MTKRTQLRNFFVGLFVTLAGVATAATFNLFSPASGILVGNPSTYVTTAATSSNVIGLWTGTCNSGTALRGDGSCGAISGGTVTSVGLTMPSGLSVAGSPVTTSGTLAVTTVLNGPVRGNGSGLVTGNTSLTTEVSGVLPVANGGIGVGTLTGLALGNGTSAFTAAASSNVISLWSGTCNGSSFLRGDGACASPGGGGTVTSITAGTGISMSPGSPITSSGTISVDATAAFTFSNASNAFTGNGSALTSLSAANISAGTLAVARGGTGTTTSTGTGNVVLSASPTLSGTITGGTFSGTHSGDGSAVTNLNMANAASGTLAVARGGTGVTTSTGSGNVVLSTSPALTTPTVGGQQVCRADGVNCPAASVPRAGARISGGGGCTIAGTPFGVGSCSRSSAGIYTINFSGAGFSDSPGCAITQTLGATPTMIYSTLDINAISITIRSGTPAGTLTDSNFNIVCLGF